jgi:carbamoyl-phosphate synthase large subunit
MTSGEMNVLISSAGRRVGLLRMFRRSLERLGLAGRLFAADMSRLSSASLLADEAFPVPRCTAPDFVPAMLDICRAHRVRLLVPTIDPELTVYAEHREQFERVGTRVLVSAPETVAIGTDKDLCHRWLRSHGFPTVEQGSVAEALAEPGRFPFPLVVKPRFGSASIGLHVVRNRDQLAVLEGDDALVQTFAPGQEYTVSALVDREGRSVCTVPRRRIEVRAGEVSKGQTVRMPALQELVRRITEGLPGAYAALNVQVFVERTSAEMNVIEINPRFGGGDPLAYEAGADFPRWLMEEILGRPSSADPDGWRDGLLMLRYDEAVYVDASRVGL